MFISSAIVINPIVGIANKKLKAHELLNDKAENTLYVVRFDEDALLLTDEVA